MGLGTVIRNAVATAHAVTGTVAVDGLQVSVTHRVIAGTDEFDKPTYTSTVRTALWEQKAQLVGGSAGEAKLASGRLVFLVPVTVNADDSFLLPDGSIASVMDVQGLGDPAGGRFYTEVLLGDSQ